MPTIEIISLNAKRLGLKQGDFNIAIIEENKLISHWGLFYDFLIKQSGVIVHIGNPEFKFDKSPGFFAGQILDWDAELGEIENPEFDTDNYNITDLNEKKGFRYKFLNKYRNDIDNILKAAIENSPTSDIYFLTDVQNGLKGKINETKKTIEEFWKLHDSNGIVFNTLYKIHE